MNEVAGKKLHEVAVQVVANQIADGKIPAERADFTALVKEFEMAVIELAERFGVKEAAPEKPAKAPRKPRSEAKGTGSAKVSPEEMREFLSKREAPTSLTVIASLLGCSKGVAERAIKALGDAVQCEKAESNGKGKPPMLYSLVR